MAIAKWLLAREYGVRLLIGDVPDLQARQEFRDLLKEHLSLAENDV